VLRAAPRNERRNAEARPLPILDPSGTSGGGGIRTLGAGVTDSTVFKTVAFNRSATPPERNLRVAPAPGARGRGAGEACRRTIDHAPFLDELAAIVVEGERLLDGLPA
jgi:hypothetical protein